MKMIDKIIELASNRYEANYDYYNDDLLEVVLSDIYDDYKDFPMEDRKEVWKIVSRSLKNKL